MFILPTHETKLLIFWKQWNRWNQTMNVLRQRTFSLRTIVSRLEKHRLRYNLVCKLSSRDMCSRRFIPIQAKSKPLTTLGSKFGYSDKFKNLLSNCQITRDKKMTAKNSNLLNLKTKRISLANNEKLFATTDSGYLFELLLRIKNVYENIGEYFLGAKDFEEQWTIRADHFTKTLSDFCNTESLWLTKLYVQLPSFNVMFSFEISGRM